MVKDQILESTWYRCRTKPGPSVRGINISPHSFGIYKGPELMNQAHTHTYMCMSINTHIYIPMDKHFAQRQ